ncbi:carbon catabolite repressor protein 4 homolog 5 isoform X1 [Punica granatum]|uniref:Carbon catabolite repressor protein 4 homolog 5 isoform X1 n=1 Tax=Punica granatum TaxID=22663 RepID=A0A6P8BTX8_PUNGR|nr:carbon catabolite repressor protein 4 homolog 5 isoform X1 [Punica granatum]XP_031373651.1 carbon catabolite repressor protein 4 homolog 5 isoform X1 [Punica granatum]
MPKRGRETTVPSRAFAGGMNKHIYFPDADVEHEPEPLSERRELKKKRKVSRVSETLTPASKPRRFPSTSNQFGVLRALHRPKQRRREISSSRVEFHREWSYSSRDFSGCRDRLVVVSYNILGVENASKHPDLYSGVPAKFLKWKRRKRLICEEIRLYNAGILCLQEVDLFQDLAVDLQKDGYDGVFKGRTGEAVDGCAIFWKDQRFTLVHEENIEFRTFGLRDNVAQLCVLKINQTEENANLPARSSMYHTSQSRHVLVGNIHVLFNPNRGDVKLGQIRLFLEKAYELSEKWGGIPVILGGDLNSVPESAVYQFLASSQLDIRLHDRRNISGQMASQSFRSMARSYRTISRPFMYRWTHEELRLAAGSYGVTSLSHQLKLSSAYIAIPGSSRCRDRCGEPIATSYHSSFMGTVDYIWHTEELVPVRVLETLPVDILRRTKGFPSKRWGSDHLALVCELAFVDGEIL